MTDSEVLAELRANTDARKTCMEARDRLVRKALIEKVPQDQIAEAAGMSQPGVSALAKRLNLR